MRKKSKGVLADTSVWIEFFRVESKIGDNLETLVKEGSVWVCGVVLYELLQGVKTEPEKSKILRALSGLPYIEMSESLWQQAGTLSAALRKQGALLPLSDILIATLATKNDLSVFTLDQHFQKIPDLKLHKP